MAKLDKSLYSKEEIKQIRDAKRERKRAKLLKKQVITFPESKDKNVLVLKHGTKYSAEYVNKMYNMVSANLEYDFNFYCITEDPTGLDPNVNVIPLPSVGVTGWWYKPYIFSKELPIQGTILYLDLDLVITNTLNRLFDFYPGQYCIIRDFTRAMRPNWEKYNSSVIKFEHGQLDHVWQRFKQEHIMIMRKFYGDQDYLWDVTQGKAKIFPDPWVQSRGNREMLEIEHVEAPADCCIVAFHGDPNPHKCHDPYIVKRWV
jgi:hypothetical protein